MFKKRGFLFFSSIRMLILTSVVLTEKFEIPFRLTCFANV